MKKKLSILLAFVACAVCAFSLVACGGGGGDTDKAVKSIEVHTEPKVEYYVGEEFSAVGGVLTVTYEDGTTEEVSMTAEGVSLTDIDMNKPGNKTVTVTYGGKRDRFSVSVRNQGFTLTFDYNYDGAQNTSVEVIKGSAATKPSDPARDGYAFYNWFADEACTMPYDFSTPVNANTTVYADWKENGKTYFEVTYDLNYYGVAPDSFTQIVESGVAAKALGTTPARGEFTFDGWYSDAAGTNAFTVTSAITADTTVYAKWTKTKSGSSTYTFEAENTDLTGKSGPGFSGSATEKSMIINNSTAAGGRAVSYMYKNGNSLEFYIACDEDTDATLTLSLAAEMDNINFTSSEFQILVNESALVYSAVNLANNNTFSDAVTVSGVSLKKGANTIVLKVNNSKRPMGTASTYEATAPMIDCVKISTTAVLAWDANFGLPTN